VSETAGGTTTDLYYSSDWQVLSEKVGSSYSKRYVWSPVYVDAMVLRDRDTDANGTLDERLWVQQDANWNVTALVNGSGAVVERYAYDPYGSVTVHDASYGTRSGSSYAWTQGFQGMFFDATAGLSDQRARWYSPTLGRWVSVDPLRFKGRDVDLYRAFKNNPPMHTDPKGETVMTVGVGGDFVFVVGGGFSVVYAWDDCGNYGYFVVMNARAGLAAGAGVEGGMYFGNLRDFEQSITVSGEINLTPTIASIGVDFDLHGKTNGGRLGIGIGVGAAAGVTFTGLIQALPHEMNKQCGPRFDKEVPLPPFLTGNRGCPPGFTRLRPPNFGMPLRPAPSLGSTIGGMAGITVGTTIGTTLGGPLGGQLGGQLGGGVGATVGGALEDIINLF
jgi:RHS repeat-associated protein